LLNTQRWSTLGRRRRVMLKILSIIKKPFSRLVFIIWGTMKVIVLIVGLIVRKSTTILSTKKYVVAYFLCWQRFITYKPHRMRKNNNFVVCKYMYMYKRFIFIIFIFSNTNPISDLWLWLT
jgi:hypothetical protein